MAELDKFTILFNSDSLKEFEQELKKSEQSLDNAEKQVKKLEEELKKLEEAENKDTKAIEKTKAALEDAKNSAENFKKTVSNMKNSTNGSLLQVRDNFIKLSKAVGALAFVGLAIRKSLNFYEQGEQLEFLAEKTGIAVEKLQQLGNAAKRYGGTTEGTAGTIENLRQQYQDARMGNASGGVKQAYLKYGFQISSDPEKTLERLAAKMETMKSDTAKWDLAKNLGIDEGTTRLLIQGQQKYNEELKKANKYKLYTKEDIQRMRDYRQISQDIRMGIESIGSTIYRGLLPVISTIAKIIRKFTDFFVKNEALVKLIASIALVTGLLLAIKPLILAIGGLLGSLNWGILLMLGLIIGAIQDFVVFMQGGESQIGKMWQAMGHDLDDMRESIQIWGERILRWVRNFIHLLNGEFDKWEHAQKDIKVINGDLSDEQKETARKRMQTMSNEQLENMKSIDPQGYKNEMERRRKESISIGKKQLQAANNNKLNSVSQNTISNSYQTISKNENDNSKTNTNSNKNINIGQINIDVNSNNPDLAGKATIQTITQLDNGQLA